MPRRKAAPSTDPLERLTHSVLTGSAPSPWPWALFRAQHFPAATDAASQRKVDEWARKNNIRWELQPEIVTVGRSRRQIRVVVLEPGRRPPIKRSLGKAGRHLS
jgi:hypothetical protein